MSQQIRHVTELFARLAVDLKSGDPTVRNADPFSDLSISTLHQSLNSNQESRVRVLDTALSLMCFTAPQVFDVEIEYLVKTIVTVLSSLAKCNVVRFNKDPILRIGDSITTVDIAEVVEACGDILGKLKGNGVLWVLSCLLLYAVLRAAVLGSCFRYVMGLEPVDVKSGDGRCFDYTKLVCYLPREMSLKNQDIPVRLLFWYLDPLMLRHDVSNILQEYVRRPFLCLSTEFHERVEWRSTVICLAISPSMFMETRNLLHNWFLLTGLASVLVLQIELVSVVLDIVSRPMRWGISAEVGFMLPFSPAYFPCENQLVRILAGPLTYEGFLSLVHCIRKTISVMKTATVDHKSMWSMAINFPDWFCFASVILFSDKTFRDNFPSTLTLGDVKNQKLLEEGALCSAAARFIAWILEPMNKSHQDMLAEYLMNIAGSFTSKQYGSNKHNKIARFYNTKMRKPRVQDDMKGYVNEYDFQTIQLWLNEFQDMHIRYSKGTVNALSDAKAIRVGQNVLFRRISLGILIGCSNQINEDGCELLLHYAATGKMIQSIDAQSAGFRQKRRISEFQEDLISWTENCSRKEVEKGAYLAFNLIDVTENMFGSLCETEESEVDFICRVKLRAGKYLLKCVKRLIHLRVHKDVLMQGDLHNRLVRWRQQGKNVFHGNKDLDDILDKLSSV